MSPPNAGSGGSPTQRNFRVTSPNGMGPASPPHAKNGFNQSILGTRSPSPRLKTSPDQERPAPPPDAFYYGRSPTSNGFSAAQRPNSLSSAADLARELKAKESEINAGKKREAALRLIIAKAAQQGFALNDKEEEYQGHEIEADSATVEKLTDALLRLKQEKASIQVSYQLLPDRNVLRLTSRMTLSLRSG